MVKEKVENVEVGSLDKEQWKVESKPEKYKRTYSAFMGAKRDYGQWCRSIEKDEEGECEMYYRPNAKTAWVCIEEFSMGDIDEDDDDEDEDDQYEE